MPARMPESVSLPVRLRYNDAQGSSQNAGIWRELARFVLNAPLSSAICVNRPVSAWGLYKNDDDQTHSDDLCCRGGQRGGNLARVGAGLSTPRRGLFHGARAFFSRR